MTNPTFPPVTFLISAAALAQLPFDQGAEVAFAGRSNVGKSSALNAITGVRGLARTSKTPGRTQLINFFSLDNTRRVVDLPGYGYAKVPLEIKARWEKTLAQYLETRTSLRGLVLLMDIRHPLKEFDKNMLAWASQRQLPLHILLTKADKLSRSVALRTLQQVNKALVEYPSATSIQLFSAQSGLGLAEARKHLLKWLNSSE